MHVGGAHTAKRRRGGRRRERRRRGRRKLRRNLVGTFSEPSWNLLHRRAHRRGRRCCVCRRVGGAVAEEEAHEAAAVELRQLRGLPAAGGLRHVRRLRLQRSRGAGGGGALPLRRLRRDADAEVAVGGRSRGAAVQRLRIAAGQACSAAISELPRRAAVQTAPQRCLKTRGDGGKPRVERWC